MACIKSKDTEPELKLKKAIRGLGFRYQPKIKGSPDFINKDKKVSIFMHGCFWHKCPKHYRVPKTNRDYWLPKIKNNLKRDKRNEKILKREGYKILIFWEHEIKKYSIGELRNKLKGYLD